MLSLTPTKLRDFLTCPQMYKLRHVDKLSVDNNPAALSFGRSLHAALEELHRGNSDNRELNKIIDPDQLLRHHWEAGAYADEQEGESYFAKGRDALQRYLDTSANFLGRVLGTEVFMSQVLILRGVRIKFGCKADRVTLDDNGILEVLDYKTNISGRLPAADSLVSDLPNFVYYLLARISYPDYKLVRVSQLNVLTLAKVEVEYDQNQIEANKKRLITQAITFASSTFDPAPSEACTWCPVQDHCPMFNNEIDLDSLI